MSDANAKQSGTFRIGGQTGINRLGFGAMRVTGQGVWGEPADRQRAIDVLKRVPELGVNFIDTADSYGPDVSERLLGEALHPYPQGVIVATKGGLTRTGPGQWIPVGRPEYLIQQAHKSLRNLKLDRIPLWQLHRIDPKVPRDEQFDAMKELQDQGLVEHLGLSNVSIEEIEAASKIVKVTTVQNRYNLADRASEAVLEHCERNGIGFIPWFPLAAGDLARPGALLDRMAGQYGSTPGQLTLAWTLKRSPVMLPIPGTSSVAHLEENVAAAAIELSDADFAALDAEGRKASQAA